MIEEATGGGVEQRTEWISGVARNGTPSSFLGSRDIVRRFTYSSVGFSNLESTT
jgi:hypothetical protein